LALNYCLNRNKKKANYELCKPLIQKPQPEKKATIEATKAARAAGAARAARAARATTTLAMRSRSH
jgi:hypothetical protein